MAASSRMSAFRVEVPPRRVILPLLDDPQQFELDVGAQVADFVQEDGAALGQFEAALLALHGPGEGAPFMAEKFALHQGFRAGRPGSP